VLDSIRLSAWLLFAVALVTLWAGDGSGIGRGYLVRSHSASPRSPMTGRSLYSPPMRRVFTHLNYWFASGSVSSACSQ
jgi:hypothetical protein